MDENTTGPMSHSTTRMFTPARLVALVLIAALIGGLTYLRVGSGTERLEVPAEAQAGDLRLEPCNYATENGSYPADCGTLVVPENRADPQSRLIALPVTRIRARSATAGEPIFRLEGGPGLTNMNFPNASRYADDRDVVLVGYRGVDGSSVLQCPEVIASLKHSTDFLSDSSMRSYSNALKECAARLSGDGVDLAGYTHAQRVDDLEAARTALGYDRIDLLSESAGTRTAMVYSWRHPTSIHRSVMIGANPPGHFLWDGATTDEQIGRYTDRCTKDESCRKRTDDLAASMQRTADDLPDRWSFLPIKQGNVRIASFYGLMESSSGAAPLSGPMTLDSWLAAADGDASGFWLLSLMSDLTFPESFVWGDLAAAAGPDRQAAHDHFSPGGQADSILDDSATRFIWGDGGLADAWPASPGDSEYSQMRTSDVETLVVSGELDGATPPQNATNELLPALPNGHQVVLKGFGHTTDFWTQQTDAGNRLINTYFESGRVDDSLYTPQTVDFTPSVTQTAMAKGLAATMIGFALVTVLSLAMMARRVHKRGHFGRTASAVLRSVFPIVLGLGGWFLGALVVLTTMPGVPLDHPLLAVISVGVPVGLGIYLAWTHRDWPVRTRRIGLAAAAAGALVGAGLGFLATVGLMALITAIFGAIAGANLALIGFDMARTRSVGDSPVVEAGVAIDESTVEVPVPVG